MGIHNTATGNISNSICRNRLPHVGVRLSVHVETDPGQPTQLRHLQPRPVAQDDDGLPVVVAGVGGVSEVLGPLNNILQQTVHLEKCDMIHSILFNRESLILMSTCSQ